jgi:GalNAc-alpha-(1->4)-GalNAc-alpha-(1->3)-diNAcBac-PP-undecaprenol alpha-1,4-N-acetyl-D-galactosaminyltransferase
MASRADPGPARLLLVTDSMQCGGAERQMAEMANYWAARGADVALATWTGPRLRDFYAMDPRVERVHLDDYGAGRIRANLRRIQKLRRRLAEHAPQAVLSFLTRSNVPAVLAAIGRGVRVVVSERRQPSFNADLPVEWRILRRLVYGRAAAVVCQTQATAAWIRRHWRLEAVVIPNALRPLPAPAGGREPLLLGVGSLKREKGFDLLLEAFARVAGAFPEWRVVLLGDGPERADLERRREALGLRDRVEFAGRVHDVEGWMARAGLVVQPSRFEGFPNAVLEGMGMGAAVVSADCEAGPSDMIDDGVNGRLVPVEDADALAGAMRELMARPDLRERLGREAMRVRERFRQDSIMARWEALLLPCAD